MIGDDDFIPAAQSQSVQPTGLIQAGNINLTGRPILHNTDGTISSEKSFSIGTDKGETLLPLIVNGKELTQQQAVDHYKQTGEHMGVFDTPDHADSYANQVHSRQLVSSGNPVYVYSGNSQNQSDFIPYSAKSAPNPPSQINNSAPQDQSGPVMRFLKAAGSRLYAGTAGAGPTQSSTISSPTDIAQWQKENSGKGFFSNIPAPFEGNDKSPLQMVGSVASELNPVDVQKFQSGDVAGGIGSTAANLLMLRQAFKSRGLPNAGELSIGKTYAMPEAAAVQDATAATVPGGEDAMEYARRGSAGEPPPSTMPQWSRQPAKGMQTGTAEGPVPAEANPNNQYVTSAPPRSNLNKNQAQMAKFQATQSGPVESSAEQGAIEQHSSLNSPTEAQAFLEQASQKLFSKPYSQLSITEKLKTLQEGGKMQQEARTATSPPVPTSDADMNDLLRQTLIKRGLTPPPQ